MFKKRTKLSTGQEQQNSDRDHDMLDLTQLENGKPARVTELRGGKLFAGKLKTMGVIPGTVILKKSTALMKGPVTIENGSTQFAIGHEMAKKIMVEPIDEQERK